MTSDTMAKLRSRTTVQPRISQNHRRNLEAWPCPGKAQSMVVPISERAEEDLSHIYAQIGAHRPRGGGTF